MFDFGQTWIWLSMLLFLAAVGVSQGVPHPAVRRMQALMAEMEQLGKRLAILGPALDLTLVVILFLMVFKPGGPSL